MARTPLHPAAPKVIITTIHYSDVIMGAMASEITGVSIVYWTICSDADQGKLQSSASLAFLSGIHRWPVNSPHKGPVTWKCFHLMTSSCPGAASVDQASTSTSPDLKWYAAYSSQYILLFLFIRIGNKNHSANIQDRWINLWNKSSICGSLLMIKNGIFFVITCCTKTRSFTQYF